MTSIIVRSTIDLHDDASNVDVAIVVGFANLLDGTSINMKPVGGTMSELFSQVKANKPYPLGSATDLITKHIRMILTGRVADPNGPVQGSYLVQCVFFQGGQNVGMSDPLSGKYAVGAALQDFNIVCSFT